MSKAYGPMEFTDTHIIRSSFCWHLWYITITNEPNTYKRASGCLLPGLIKVHIMLNLFAVECLRMSLKHKWISPPHFVNGKILPYTGTESEENNSSCSCNLLTYFHQLAHKQGQGNLRRSPVFLVDKLIFIKDQSGHNSIYFIYLRLHQK